MLTRKEANKEILQLIGELVELFPDQRFGQIIANYVFPTYQERDIFFEESVQTLRWLNHLKNAKPGPNDELPSVR